MFSLIHSVLSEQQGRIYIMQQGRIYIMQQGRIYIMQQGRIYIMQQGRIYMYIMQQGRIYIMQQGRIYIMQQGRMHKCAYIKTIECNNVLSSSIGFAHSSWNFVKRYDLDALSKIHVCNKVVTMIRSSCTEHNPCLQQGRNYDTTLLHWAKPTSATRS